MSSFQSPSIVQGQSGNVQAAALVDPAGQFEEAGLTMGGPGGCASNPGTK